MWLLPLPDSLPRGDHLHHLEFFTGLFWKLLVCFWRIVCLKLEHVIHKSI